MMLLGKLRLLAAFANTIYNNFIGDPLNEMENYLSLSPKDVYDTPTSTSLSTELLQDQHRIDNMIFSDVTWVSSHNAFANKFAAADNIFRNLAINQENSVYKQLKEGGVRGLMLDIAYKDGSLQCVHGFVEFGLLRDLVVNEILPFINEDEECIITIDFETKGDVELIRNALRDLLEQTPDFASRIFRVNDERWENHTAEWPTIAQMRAADQRVLILVDNPRVASNDMGIHFRYNVTTENHWKGSLDSCSPRNGYIANNFDIPWSIPYISGFDKGWARLFTMNHFCCSTGVQSLRHVNPSHLGGGDNGWGVLFPRMMLCIAESGLDRKPNFVAIDWVNIGDVHEIVDYMNFGGKLGVGQRCESGLDCATGACSVKKQCHCQLCSSTGCSGCQDDESCVAIEDGVHVCATSIATNATNLRLSSNTAITIGHVQPLLLVSLLLLFIFI